MSTVGRTHIILAAQGWPSASCSHHSKGANMQERSVPQAHFFMAGVIIVIAQPPPPRHIETPAWTRRLQAALHGQMWPELFCVSSLDIFLP